MLLLALILNNTIDAQVNSPSLPQNGSVSVPKSQETPDIQFERFTPDGAMVVKVKGIEYRLVSADELRAIQLNKAELDSLRSQVQIYSKNLSDLSQKKDQELKKIQDDYESQLQIEKNKTATAEQQYKNEKDINQKIQQNSHNKTPIAYKVLTSPVTAALVNIGNFILKILGKR